MNSIYVSQNVAVFTSIVVSKYIGKKSGSLDNNTRPKRYSEAMIGKLVLNLVVENANLVQKIENEFTEEKTRESTMNMTDMAYVFLKDNYHAIDVAHQLFLKKVSNDMIKKGGVFRTNLNNLHKYNQSKY